MTQIKLALSGDAPLRRNGSLRYTWASEPGPDDWCTQPLWSIDGSFERRQTRSYALDPATGQYLEYFRLVNLQIADSLAAAPDADPTTGVKTRLQMTWRFRLRPAPFDIGEGWHVIEQHAFADVTERIDALDLVCSGFRAERPSA